MAKQDKKQIEALQSKRGGLVAKLEALKKRGPGWHKAIVRTENFIKEVDEALEIAEGKKEAPKTPEPATTKK